MNKLPKFLLLAEELPKAEVFDIKAYLKSQFKQDQGVDVILGEKGSRGEPGRRGRRGLVGRQGEGEIGPKGDKGDKGDQGVKGDLGLTGLSPEHQWRDTKLRFQNPDGSWGSFVMLKGDTGGRGLSGGGGGGRSASEGFDEVVLNGNNLEFRRASAGPMGQPIIISLSSLSGSASLSYFLGE